jgi:hypothetical protein
MEKGLRREGPVPPMTRRDGRNDVDLQMASKRASRKTAQRSRQADPDCLRRDPQCRLRDELLNETLFA